MKATLSGVLGIICLLSGCKNDSKPTNAPSVVQAAAPVPNFGDAQDDHEGYNRTPWGTTLADFVKPDTFQPSSDSRFGISDLTEAKLVAKVFNVPETGRSIAGVDLSDTNWSVVPAKFQSVMRDDIEFIFYDGKLAMTFSEMHASNYGTLKSTLASKYPQLDSINSSWKMQQLEENPDVMELNALLFKKGQTNTRIYLMKAVEHEGIGIDETRVYVLYTPNIYYQAIRNDIANYAAPGIAAKAAQVRASEDEDLQKIDSAPHNSDAISSESSNPFNGEWVGNLCGEPTKSDPSVRYHPDFVVRLKITGPKEHLLLQLEEAHGTDGLTDLLDGVSQIGNAVGGMIQESNDGSKHPAIIFIFKDKAGQPSMWGLTDGALQGRKGLLLGSFDKVVAGKPYVSGVFLWRNDGNGIPQDLFGRTPNACAAAYSMTR